MMADETPAPLSDAEIAEIAERAAHATPGPWEQYGVAFVTSNPHHNHIATCDLPVNSIFIAAARADVPHLIATVKSLRSALDHGFAEIRAKQERLLAENASMHETWRQDAELRYVREHEDHMREYAYAVDDPRAFEDGRLRLRIAELEREIAAYREIVAAVAGYRWQVEDAGDWNNVAVSCPWSCGVYPKAYDAEANERLQHAPDCPVTRARALLGTQTPGATGATAGQEGEA